MVKGYLKAKSGKLIDFQFYEEDRNRYLTYFRECLKQEVLPEILKEEQYSDFGKDINTRQESKNYVCYIGDNEQGVYLSQYYAEKMRKQFICTSETGFHDFINNLDINRSVVFVVELDKAERIQKMLSLCTPFIFGIYIYDNLNDLLFCFNKSIIQSEIDRSNEDINSLTINRVDFTTETTIQTENSCYIPRKLATKENFVAEIQDKDLLSFIGHGRDELIWITDGVICPGKCNAKDNPSRQTCCQITNECFKNPIDIIKISDIKVRHIFINACSSGKMTSGVYGLSYNVARQFMVNNAVTYIGTPFLASCCPSLNSFYEVLIKQGYSIGEICKKINDVYNIYNYGQGISFFLYGDPDYMLTERKQIPVFDFKFDTTHTVIALESNYDVVKIKISDMTIEDFLNYRKGISIKAKDIKQLNAIFFPVSGKCIEGYIFGSGCALKGQLSLEMFELPSFDVGTISEYRFLVEMGLSTPRLKNYYYESMNSVQNYHSEELDSLFQVNSVYPKNYSKRLKIFDRYQKLSSQYTELLQNKIAKKGFAFDAQCMESGFRFEKKLSGEQVCPYCHSKTFKYQIYNRLYKVHRINEFCIKCGVIFDGADEDIDIHFCDASEAVVIDGSREVCVSITDNSNSELYGHLAVAVANDSDMFSYSPTLQQVDATDECSKYYFRIDNELSIRNHGYWLQAVANINGKLYFIKKDIFYK